MGAARGRGILQCSMFANWVSRGGAVGLTVLAALLALPVLVLVGAWWTPDDQAWALLAEMRATVLPDYAMTSVLLCVGVALGVMVLGLFCAVAVTLFDFPGRRVLEWALLLPMALPAYVVAYAYTDFLQYAGPLQTLWRGYSGATAPLWPDIRSLWGAVLVFSFTLYPYVYLLARTALLERAAHLMEAARLLGASMARRVWQVALPLARPAIAAGTALALMETLADYGVSSYFGIQTFTAGVFKAWLVMDNRLAAAQLATLLMGFVAVLLWVEQRAQARLRFASARISRTSLESRPVRLGGAMGLTMGVLCALPLLLGFVVPVLILLASLSELRDLEWSWARFGEWARTSVWLAAGTAGLAALLALLLAAHARLFPRSPTQALTRVVGLGYAVPGAVIVVGVLWPIGWLQARDPEAGYAAWFTGTVLALVWAYLVRLVAVALQGVQSAYARLPHSLDESARTLGQGEWAVFRRIHLPLLRRPLAVALLLVMVDTMKELPATLVLRPFNTDTLAVMAYQLARDERLAEAAVPSLALVVVGLIPVLLIARSLRAR